MSILYLQSFHVFCFLFLKAVRSWTMLRPGGDSGSSGLSLGSHLSVPPPPLKSWSSISSCPNMKPVSTLEWTVLPRKVEISVLKASPG